MITYIDSSNAAKYSALFTKATDAIAKAIEANDETIVENGINNNNFSGITSLEQYFYYLPILMNINYGTDEYFKDEGRRYAILPVDEELFEIDANSRLITVPKNFKQSGIGVIGDQMAEVVYFKMPRYHDFTDLNTTEIYIQWAVQTATMTQPKTGISKAWVRDIETDPNSIIFGWALDTEITGLGGKITFSVRCILFNTDASTANETPFTYSFSTLDAQVSLNSALNLSEKEYFLNSEWDDYFKKIDNILMTRAKQGIKVGAVRPSSPIFTTDLSKWTNEKTQVDLIEMYIEVKITQDTFDKTVHYTRTIDENGNYTYRLANEYNKDATYYIKDYGYEFAVHAYLPDATGTLSYLWEKNGENNSKQISNNYIYKLTNDTKVKVGKIYYELKNGNYEIDESADEVGEEMPYELSENGDKEYLPRYEKLNSFIATSHGNYEVFATNTIAESRAQKSGGIITIPGATKPQIQNNGGNKLGFVSPTTTEIELNPQLKTVEGEKYEYQWYFSPNKTAEKEIIPNATGDTYTIVRANSEFADKFDASEATGYYDKQGAYSVSIKAIRNKDNKSNTSEAFVVTKAPDSIIDVEYSLDNQKWQKNTTIIGNVGNTIYARPVFEGGYQIEDYQKLTYTWYFRKAGNTEQIGESEQENNSISATNGLSGASVFCKITNTYNNLTPVTGPNVNNETGLPPTYVGILG